jgi:serine protease Do
LLDLDGRVVGITSAIFSRSGGYMGIGFAVPANIVRDISRQLRETGKVSRGFLGVGIQDLTPDLAQAFHIGRPGGALINEVQPDGAAAKAGVTTGDVVVAVDGHPVDNGGALRNAIALARPGTEVRITLYRDGASREVRVRLGSRKDDAPSTPTPATPTSRAEGLGLQLAPLDDALRARLPFDVDRGVVVTGVAPGSTAALAGLAPGDVVESVDREPVTSVDAFEKALSSDEDGGVLLRVRGERGARWVVLRLR